MIYVYIPFNSDEQNKHLLNVAATWQQIFEKHSVSHQIITMGKQLSLPESSAEKIKIYLLAYAAAEVQNQIVPYPGATTSINLDNLIERLFHLKLPNTRAVEIKFCIQQSTLAGSVALTDEIVAKKIEEHGYLNPNLVIRVQCSTDAFPVADDKASKLGFRAASGTLPLSMFSLAARETSSSVEKNGETKPPSLNKP